MPVSPPIPRNMVVMHRPQAGQQFPDSGIVLVYIYFISGFWHQATRFVTSYRKRPPMIGHRTVIVLNDPIASRNKVVAPSVILRRLFQDLQRVTYFTHDDSGWDIGAYMALAKTLPEDTPMFCCGGHSHFRRAGWLKRLHETWQKHGPGLYGTLASYEIRPHFCTTGFLIPAGLLLKYTTPTLTKEQRYAFEHGENHIVTVALNNGYPVRLVTWDGVYPIHEWRKPQNIYARGNQSNCLTYFNHSDSYERSDANEKIRRQKIADTLTVPMLYENCANIPACSWEI